MMICLTMECLRLHTCDLCERENFCKEDKDLHYSSLIKLRNASIKKAFFITGSRPGIGTSIYSIMHAYQLSKQNYKVALLETSNLFSSYRYYFNLDNFEALKLYINGIIPIKIFDNLSFISPSLFLQANKDKVLIWDNMEILSFVKNMIININWGDIDYLIVDLDANHVFLINYLQNFLIDKFHYSILITDKFFLNDVSTKLFFNYINENTKIMKVISSYNSSLNDIKIGEERCLNIPNIQGFSDLLTNRENLVIKLQDFYDDITKEAFQSCKQIY